MAVMVRRLAWTVVAIGRLAQNWTLVTAPDGAVRYGESESCASLPRWSRARSPCRPASSPFAGRQAWILQKHHGTNRGPQDCANGRANQQSQPEGLAVSAWARTAINAKEGGAITPSYGSC